MGPQVLYVESLTDQKRVERELVLIKVRAPSGAARQEVSQLARIYGASMLDASGPPPPPPPTSRCPQQFRLAEAEITNNTKVSHSATEKRDNVAYMWAQQQAGV